VRSFEKLLAAGRASTRSVSQDLQKELGSKISATNALTLHDENRSNSAGVTFSFASTA
jgi:hypothetical protein